MPQSYYSGSYSSNSDDEKEADHGEHEKAEPGTNQPALAASRHDPDESKLAQSECHRQNLRLNGKCGATSLRDAVKARGRVSWTNRPQLPGYTNPETGDNGSICLATVNAGDKAEAREHRDNNLSSFPATILCIQEASLGQERALLNGEVTEQTAYRGWRLQTFKSSTCETPRCRHQQVRWLAKADDAEAGDGGLLTAVKA